MRNSQHRQRPQKVAHEDVSAWHRRLVALGTETFGDIGQWSQESRSVVTNCFIRWSRHASKLAMYVNRTMLEAANSTIRSEHLDSLARLCRVKTFEDQDIYPLNNYHFAPEPAAAAGAASSLAVAANSEQKSSQWMKKEPLRYPDCQPKKRQTRDLVKEGWKMWSLQHGK